ncbi:hypothetical protein C4G66_RS23430 [Vibrio parahaemolyticus]|uniref:Uncharacterized protein n=2 Tax=Vibrio parahaemolyticus TaxID=670 RepID=A0AA47JDT2_VIBPH|nr:hypothetical protein [Vibrio parahaemolyticus]EIE1275327.1 hypothetical protein [Vibrio parahaemolyticus]EJG0989840.1 hypothetical protein [Vibrio parahaemolyticus]EJG1071803.1 hypothetical protein [Vibrio parahaemolyticus]ELA8113189.1 hypothetical protein [Vibrio parahaemolyticus]ELA8166995.1 hypothetical protein [Vibrio parahaemolyticus]
MSEQTKTQEPETNKEQVELKAVESSNTERTESWEKRYYSKEAIKERAKAEEIRKQEKAELRRILSVALVFCFAFFVLYFLSINNPDLYAINPETLTIVNEAFNALVLLMVPFFLGSLGAIARVLLAGMKVTHSLTLIVSSGMMGMFSWVGIKSGILVALLTPYIQPSNNNVQSTVELVGDAGSHNFYSMALVAIIIGMFSSNVYIFVNQKVERLTKEEVKRSSETKA